MSGATILAVGGTLAALIQTIGYAQHAGGIMLAANIITIAIAARARWLAKNREGSAS